MLALAADHGNAAFGEIGIERFDRRDGLAAGVLHEHERRQADLLDRPPIGFAHLLCVENPHRERLAASLAHGVRSLAMGAYVNVNSAITDAAHAVIPVYDHGFYQLTAIGCQQELFAES